MIAPQAARRQALASIDATIRDSESVIALSRRPSVGDQHGGTVPNPYGIPATVWTRGRIAPFGYRTQMPTVGDVTPSGISDPDTQFILVRAADEIEEGDRLTYNGYWWRVGPVERIMRFGVVVAKQAALTRGDQISGET